ncbi:hypothetical protein [Vannielia sp.]|uniref:hypothetical protein n=1 Tax=Vannielia sp. TaxID=2813045 RepID=UPI00261D97E9|nr:hypothetical protein [Vannielia sp.]MDF1873503.1 hypothetical protein [Vannielia sp.]
MSDFLPMSVREGLEAARKDALRRKSRLNVRDGEASWPVLRHWSKGFSVPADPAPNLRGLVDLCDGETLLFTCLIVASRDENDERIFEFKRATPAADAAALDFARSESAPAGLIAKA